MHKCKGLTSTHSPSRLFRHLQWFSHRLTKVHLFALSSQYYFLSSYISTWHKIHTIRTSNPFWYLLRASSNMTLRESKVDNAVPIKGEAGRSDPYDSQRGLTIKLFYVISRWSNKQRILPNQQQCWDKDASRSLPEGQSPHVCMAPCTLAHRMPGSSSALLIPIVRCWILASWLALRINVKSVSIRSMFHIKKMRSLCTATSRHSKKTKVGVRRPIVTHRTEWSRPYFKRWTWRIEKDHLKRRPDIS